MSGLPETMRRGDKYITEFQKALQIKKRVRWGQHGLKGTLIIMLL
jgi:hypothetical protein